jgi:site-specific DNA recombinase
MSTDRQEESIAQQRDWAERACQREGVELVDAFDDPGIAGDEIKLWPGLQKLLERCEEGGVDCVVCWNADRFSRADSIRTAALICRLLDAGVSRMLTAEGWIDFEDDTDRVLHAVRQDLGRSAYSKTLSANVSRACLARARDGKWNGGRLPYAYVVGPDQHLALGDPGEVETVRTIFHLVASGLSSFRVVRHLNRLGAPRPKYGSTHWTKPTVYGIVTNRKYTGAMDYGNLHQGKYNECSAEGVRRRRRSPKTAGGRLRQVAAPAADVVVVEGAHPAIVDRELWDRAQRALASNRIAFQPGQKQPQRRCHKWPLGGLIYCEQCQGRMYGIQKRLRGEGQTGEIRRYLCGTYIIEGKKRVEKRAGQTGCDSNWIDEDVLQPLVFDAVRQALDNPEGRRRVRAAVAGELKRGHRSSVGQARKLRRQAEELTAKIRQGVEKLALLPADLVEDVSRQVREWKDKREEMLAEATRLEEAEAQAADEQERIEEAMAAFRQLGDYLAGPESNELPAELKAEALATLVERIDLRFAPRIPRKPQRCKSKQGERKRCAEFTVHFRAVAGVLDRLTVNVQRRSPAASR